MSWHLAKPYAVASKGATAIVVNCSVRVRESDRAVAVTISLNQRAQEALFGGPLVGERLRIDVGRAHDQGKLRLAKSPEGLLVRGGPKGMARIVINAWDLVPKEVQASTPLSFVSVTSDGVVFELPSWGQPEAARARMEEKFGVGSAGQMRGGVAHGCAE